MSVPPAHKRIPRLVAARKFAYQGVVLEGQIPEHELRRLEQAVQGIHGPVEVKLHFATDDSGHRTLSGTLRGRVSITCQRCMQSMPVELEAEIAVAMVGSDEEARQLPQALEPWLIDREELEADLYEVVEDELLLSLPMVVYHDYACIDESLYSSGEEDAAASPEDVPPNPFHVLQQLKVGKKD